MKILTYSECLSNLLSITPMRLGMSKCKNLEVRKALLDVFDVSQALTIEEMFNEVEFIFHNLDLTNDSTDLFCTCLALCDIHFVLRKNLTNIQTIASQKLEDQSLNFECNNALRHFINNIPVIENNYKETWFSY